MQTQLQTMRTQLELMDTKCRLVRTALRENDRWAMWRTLGRQHDNKDWSYEVQKEIVAFFNKDGFDTFLKDIGYVRRGAKRFHHPYDDELPDVVMTPSLATRFFTDVPAEIVNLVWLRSRQKRRATAQKAARTTKAKRRVRAEEEKARRATTAEVPPPPADSEYDSEGCDSLSAGGF